MKSVYEVLIEGLQLYAYHGVPDAEREVGHRYLIDLKLEVDGKADESDDVGDTIDYGAAGKIALGVAETSQFRTVEKLAGEIGLKLLASFEILEAVEVRVVKPMPPAPLLAAVAGVMVRSERRARAVGK
jgi:dihydroneopterin aldolase